MASSKSVEKSSHLAFLRLKRLLNGVGCGTITGWTVTQIGWCCVRGIGSRTDFSHISGGSRNGSGGGLYRECTTTPGSSTVMNSTFLFSYIEMLFTFRPSLTKTELPCLLCGRSATSVIPGIFGLAWSLARCVSWRHRQWQCCILHNSDSMDALLLVLADRPSTFADITVISLEGL